MSDLFWFEWTRCIDGYQHVEMEGFARGDIRPVSTETETYNPFRLGTEDRVLFQPALPR